MMPPTSIDGTDITGATIDGTEVQEITVDGQTVFTAGPDIPDSAVWQTPYDEGSGSTVADIIGNADGTVNGATWKSSASTVGGQYLEFDGSDNVDYGTASVLDLNPQGEWTIEIGARIDPAESGTLLSKAASSGDRQWHLFVSSNEYAVRLGGNSIRSSVTPSGNWEVLTARNDDGNFDLFVDGSLVASGSGGSSTNSGQTVYAGARSSGSDFTLTGDLDSPVIHDVALSNSTISDRADAYPNWGV